MDLRILLVIVILGLLTIPVYRWLRRALHIGDHATRYARTYPIILILAIMLVSGVVLVYAMYFHPRTLYPTTLSPNISDWVAFAEFFNGVVTPALTFFALLLLVLSVNDSLRAVQREIQLGEAESQRATFFELRSARLTALDCIRGTIDYTAGAELVSGQRSLREVYRKNLRGFLEKREHESPKEVIENWFKDDREELEQWVSSSISFLRYALLLQRVGTGQDNGFDYLAFLREDFSEAELFLLAHIGYTDTGTGKDIRLLLGDSKLAKRLQFLDYPNVVDPTIVSAYGAWDLIP